jgi:hypothetical protein
MRWFWIVDSWWAQKTQAYPGSVEAFCARHGRETESDRHKISKPRTTKRCPGTARGEGK